MGHGMINIGSDLVGAVDRGEILAYFQPQVDVASGAIVSVEALSRWQHPQLGLLSADAYIRLAETTGLINDIGDFMLDEGCRCAAKWNALGIEVEVAVNVSAAQLAEDAFFDRLLSNLRDLDIPMHRLILEITESLAIEDRDHAAQRLDGLKRAGVEISIDDFGSGFSSMLQVLSLPATELKIDRSLVQAIGDEAEVEKMISETVELAHGRGLRVVAEGVETDSQLDLVRGLGCDRVQGFLTGEAVTEAEMEALLLGDG